MPKSTKHRSIRLVRTPEIDGVGVFCIREKNKDTYYTFNEIPCELGGRGFEVHRTGLGDLYHVRIGAKEECCCECRGYLRWGHCKHITGLIALANHNML